MLRDRQHFDMSKLKISLYHLLVFVVGSIAVVAYVFYRLTFFTGGAGLVGIIVMPAVVLIYVFVFGALCVISLVAWLLVSSLRRGANKKRLQ